MINNPTAKGKTTEAKILAELVEAGKSVLIPWGEERYDLALDEGARACASRPNQDQLRGSRWARDFELPRERITSLFVPPF